MIYRWLAYALVVFHLAVCVFFLFGGPFCIVYPWLAVFHLPLALWVSSAFLCGWTCPLTPPEKWLWRMAGEEGYEGGFVERYIFRPLSFSAAKIEPEPRPGPKKRRNEILLGLFFLTLTLVVHGANLSKYRGLLWPELSKPPEMSLQEKS